MQQHGGHAEAGDIEPPTHRERGNLRAGFMNRDGSDFVERSSAEKKPCTARVQADEIAGANRGIRTTAAERFALRAGHHNEVEAQGVAEFR